MDLILEGILKAFYLLVTFDPEVMKITLLPLQISGTATFISLITGISIGTIVALAEFPGKRVGVSLINIGMGLFHKVQLPCRFPLVAYVTGHSLEDLELREGKSRLYLEHLLL